MTRKFIAIVLYMISVFQYAICETVKEDKPDFMINVYGRQNTSLNGTWNAIIDLFNQGINKSVWLNRKPTNNTEFFEYGWENGLQLKVPGDFNSQSPHLLYYEGTVWYGRHFKGVSGERQFLYFGAVSQRCTVYLNGQWLASHDGGFTPFQIEVTGKLNIDDNFIAVAVNNDRLMQSIPALAFDWWNYGGITRDVMLVSTPKVYIKDYMVQLDPKSSKVINASVQMSDPVESGAIAILEIPELKIKEKISLSNEGIGQISIQTKKIHRWSPEDPKQYKVQLSFYSNENNVAPEDIISEDIGFRNISVDGVDILLNGKKTFMRSVSFHEEISSEMRRACTEEDSYQLLSAAKDLGVNLVRLTHYPQNEHTLRLAEKMGIMIWQEIPVWQGIDFANEETMNKAQIMFSEMIYRDKNRCCVAFWGIQNETRPSEDRDRFLRKELAFARSIDSTRLYTGAFDNVYFNKEAGEFQINDDIIWDLDVVSFNKYMGWYESWPCAPKDCKWNVAEGKPVIISEFGCEALMGKHDHPEAASSWSEEYQAELYRCNIEMFKQIPNLAGISPWVLYDFRSPYRFHPTNQDGWNRKGLLSDKGEKKQSWYIIHDLYNKILMYETGESNRISSPLK